MSKLDQKNDSRTTIRRTLLTGASVLVFTAHIGSATATDAAYADKPILWLEAGGQFDLLDDNVSKWIPEFVPGLRTGPLAYQFPGMQRQPKFGYDAFSAISFQPHGSDWSLYASLQIGRARQPAAVVKTENTHGYGANANIGYYQTGYHGTAQNNESHLLIDFRVGKDVGLGIFDQKGDSTLRFGARIAQLHSRTDVHVKTEFPISARGQIFNWADTRLSRKFAGVGPSVAWDGSTPIAGTLQDGELTVDWSAAAALLFGRQTKKQDAKATYQAIYIGTAGKIGERQQTQYTSLRRRSVTIPNLGGSIGVSYRWATARVALGYRADFFFNAMDGGSDSRKNENRGFFGPYASISIGIGN